MTQDGAVARHEMKFEDIVKSLIWSESGKTRKIPLRDLRLFRLSSQQCISSPLLSKDLRAEISHPSILPRPKAQCYLLDLDALKLLCRNNQVDVLYANESGPRRSAVNQFVQELRANLANSKR